jgi:hypothetical protein
MVKIPYQHRKKETNPQQELTPDQEEDQKESKSVSSRETNNIV